jgi:DNA polymerase III epsilon subunit-like protein
MKIIYFDLETGGVLEQHPIIQIAAIAIDDATWQELDAIEMKLQFNISDADPEALKINHYDAAVWRAEAIPVGQAIGRFARFLEPHKSLHLISKRSGRPYSVAQLAGHNAATFDGPRLQNMFRATGAFLPADPRVLDTMQRAMWFFQERGTRPEDYKLGTLCKHFGIEVGDDAHDALADVRLTIQLARALRENERKAA